jgi:glutamyl-tRNA reductase
MNELRIIALTHKNLDVNSIGFLHLDNETQKTRLPEIKKKFGFNELMFLTTCNRVEFILVSPKAPTVELLNNLFLELNSGLSTDQLSQLANNAGIYSGEEAVRHLFNVASSVDSLVVGEREIITQVRKAYEFCTEIGITGDIIRLLIKNAIVTAKEVYTQTGISNNPVSVVSLAYRKLRELNVANDARFIIIGAGETNTTMAKYLRKHEYANFSVFNRTISKAETLAAELKGKAYSLSDLKDYRSGFDVIITCTASCEPIITTQIYASLLCGETTKKVVIDLAIPNDLDATVPDNFDLNLIAVSNLREIAAENMCRREGELKACHEIIENHITAFEQLFLERKVEIAFSAIPVRVKEIKETALNEVFAKDLTTLDDKSKEVLDKVLTYMEKKYNAVAMKTAKEALLDHP